MSSRRSCDGSRSQTRIDATKHGRSSPSSSTRFRAASAAPILAAAAALPWGERPRAFRNAGAVRRLLGVSDGLVGEVGDAVTDGAGVEEAHGFLVAGLAEEALAGSEHDREDLQPQLVDQVVLHQRAYELEAGGDDDFPVELLLQLRDLLNHVALEYRRVVPDGMFESRGHDVLGQVVQPVRQLATAGWPPRGEPLVAAPAQQQGLGAEGLVERELVELWEILDQADPAAVLEALVTGRVLNDSVERDVVAHDDLSHFGSPFVGVASYPRRGRRGW